MRKIRCRAQPTRRPTVAQAILIGLALLFPAVQAAEPPRLSDKTAVESAERALIDRCSNARRSKQPSTGENPDFVAAQLLLTIERTDSPALRKKLVDAYRRYLNCPADLQSSAKSGTP